MQVDIAFNMFNLFNMFNMFNLSNLFNLFNPGLKALGFFQPL